MPKPKEMPTAEDIAKSVTKQMRENTQPSQGAQPEIAQKTEKAPPKPKSTPKPTPDKHSSAMPKETEKVLPTPTITSVPLLVLQSSKISTRVDAPFQTEITVQTTTNFDSLKFALQCNKPLVDGIIANSGVRTMTSFGVLKDHPNIFIYNYGSASPPFGPANPLIIELWSKEPVTCRDAATF